MSKTRDMIKTGVTTKIVSHRTLPVTGQWRIHEKLQLKGNCYKPFKSEKQHSKFKTPKGMASAPPSQWVPTEVYDDKVLTDGSRNTQDTTPKCQSGGLDLVISEKCRNNQRAQMAWTDRVLKNTGNPTTTRWNVKMKPRVTTISIMEGMEAKQPKVISNNYRYNYNGEPRTT